MSIAVLAVFAAVNILLYYVPLVAADPNLRDKGGRRSLRAAVTAGMAAGIVFTPLFVVSWFLWEDTTDLTTPFLANVLLTGQIEELAKFLTFVYVLKRMRAFREPLDAAMHAAAVGLGFSVLENVLYGMEYGIRVQFDRMFICTPGHMIYCVITAVYYAGLRTGGWQGRIWRSPASIFLVLIPSATMHGLYNYLIDVNLWGVGVVLDLFGLAAAMALVVQLRRASPYQVTVATVPAARLAQRGSPLLQALARDPSSPVLNRRLAEAQLRMGRYPTAIAHLDMCLVKDPANLEIHALKGSAMIARGHTAQGTRLLERAALAAGYQGRRRLERTVLRVLGMRTPATTPRVHLSSRYLIVSVLRAPR